MWQLFVLTLVLMTFPVSVVAGAREWRRNERMRKNPSYGARRHIARR